MQTFARGATIRLSVSFLDADGLPTSPASANAYLSYRATDGRRAIATVALSLSGGNWVGTWDSRGARAGNVNGHVRTAPSTPLSALDFVFALAANDANL